MTGSSSGVNREIRVCAGERAAHGDAREQRHTDRKREEHT